MLKDWLRSVINPLGIDVVKYPLSPIGRRLRDFIREQRINLVVDVGACDGGFCHLLRNEGEYHGPIVSFEPTVTSFKALSQKMSTDRNWRGLQIALSDTDGEGVLITFDDNLDFNSLLHLREAGAASYGVDTSKRRSEPIIVRKFDTLWNDITLGIENPRIFLKTDTQGHDTSVVRGAKEHLPFIIGLQSEVPAIELYDGMVSMSDTLKLLRDLGYSPIGFYEVNRPEAYDGLVPEFDVIFKRIESGAKG